MGGAEDRGASGGLEGERRSSHNPGGSDGSKRPDESGAEHLDIGVQKGSLSFERERVSETRLRTEALSWAGIKLLLLRLLLL